MAILSTEVRTGDVIRLSNALYKVQGVNLHTGGGKTGAMVHMKLRHLDTGRVTENRFATTEKLDKLTAERVPMKYLYSEGQNMVFMHPTTFEQCRLSTQSIGAAGSLFKEGDTINVELYEGKPIAIDFPDAIELEVVRTGAGLRGDSTYKEAQLTNGAAVMVPQFIKVGDVVRISVETLEYIDRVHEKTEKQVFKPAAKKPEKGGV